MEFDRPVRDKPIHCPFCDSSDTEMIALFGMQMMTSQFYCHNCKSAFEAVKWEPRGADASEGGKHPKA